MENSSEIPDAREEAANLAHDIWCGWMQYFFKQTTRLDYGDEVISAELAYRWRRQMITPYSDLSEKEKESDREIARLLILPLNKDPVSAAALAVIAQRDGENQALRAIIAEMKLELSERDSAFETMSEELYSAPVKMRRVVRDGRVIEIPVDEDAPEPAEQEF